MISRLEGAYVDQLMSRRKRNILFCKEDRGQDCQILSGSALTCLSSYYTHGIFGASGVYRSLCGCTDADLNKPGLGTSGQGTRGITLCGVVP